MPSARVSVIIPVYNNWAITAGCLESLASHMHEDWFEVLLVDDGSVDQTPLEGPCLGQALFHQRFRMIMQPANAGFAAAINRGAREARGDVLFLLNNDTVVIEDCLTPCLKALREDASLAGVGPTLVYPGEARLQHLGVTVAHSIKCLHLYHLFPASHAVARRQRKLQYLSAAAMCLRREVFQEFNGFHEGYINGMEDVDFCAQASARGKGFAVLPHTRLIHAEHQSQGRFQHEAHNSALLKERCGTLLTPDMHRLAEADGYRLGFTQWLDPVLTLSPERQRAMQARWAERKTIPSALELLEEEPLWAKGYEVAARMLEQEGYLAGALQVRVRQGAFLPALALLDEIVRLARDCHDGHRREAALQQRSRIRQAMADSAALKALAAKELDSARTRGDVLLQEIWETWMHSYSA